MENMVDTDRLASYWPALPLWFDYSLQRLHRRARTAFVTFQDMSFYPLRFDQVPPLFGEPFIERGFRALHQPWSYYWNSLLHKHNEFINVWSHLIGIVCTIVCFLHYHRQMNFLSNPHAWPFAVAFCTAGIMFACSAFAHLLHSKSELVHMTCFLIDFLGVSLHGFGSGLVHIYYSSPQWYYEKVEHHFMFVLLPCGIVACFSNCFAQYYFHRPYPPLKRVLQFLPCGLMWLYAIIPLVIRIVSSSFPLSDVLVYHLAQIILFLLGATLFAFDLPQRFCPGALDFFGQGHHLFHLCIYLVCMLQMQATYQDYQTYRSSIEQRSAPELIFCAGSMFSLIVWDIVIVWYFRRMIRHHYHHD